MNDIESKRAIASSLNSFTAAPLAEAATALFGSLGYKSEKRFTLKPNAPATFVATFAREKPFNQDLALVADWQSVDFLFQLTDDEVRAAAGGNQQFLFESKGRWLGAEMDSYLFFAITLTKPYYSRTELSAITRAVNRLFPMPAMLLFRHGDTLTLALINRRLHKLDSSKDVLEKVTLIKDIRLVQPHRAHIEILYDLSIGALCERQPCDEEITNFVTLHRAWQKTLDIQALNKRFFIEVRNWFYWARLNSRFPAGAKKDADKRDSEALIRLLTRMIFIWFIREKHLIPDELFAEHTIGTLMRDWSADDCEKDKEGRYYKAILQNLFFATLNTPVEKRKFRSARTHQGKNRHYGDQRFFRHVGLFQEKAPVEELYRSIPFLNGGLFEMLDEIPGRGDESITEEKRVDGFSDISDKQPLVPDFLFFGNERGVPELSTLLDESTPPKARGLLHIFRHYKFTIEENTPLEEDIALDPELLGRAFENLLAAVNPETGTVARKSTGSYYTPREIVNYMVEEALVRRLLAILGAEKKELPYLEERLRELISVEKESHRFDDGESRMIVQVIGELRILDLACGSGAFPMGLLQRLVHVLHKLDPGNQHWKATKLATLPQEMRVRAETVFREESFDYTRKLELIRDCIHGVDVQPAAIQISKLRFFLSLVIEQNEPRHIRPLPNLETKFVCANSLLGLPRPAGWELFQHQIEPQESELLEVRARYFFALPDEKDAFHIQDEKLRRKLGQFIEGIGGSAAHQLASAVAAWSPYKPDRVAGYFDPASMFGVRNGFDITIGNPPYVRADEQSDWNQRQREQILASTQYETLWEKWDLFVPFIERAYKLLKPDGITTLIVSDAFCHSKYAQKPQNWFLKNARILRLDFCSNLQIFDAAVHNLIYFFQRTRGTQYTPDRRVHVAVFGNIVTLPSDEQEKLTHRLFFPEDVVAQAFACKVLPLESICYISKGMVVHADEEQARGEFTLEDLVSDCKDAKHSKPFVEGKHLQRWLPADQKWLEWGTKRAPALFSRPTFPEIYTVSEKLISVDMSAGVQKLRVAYDDKQLIHNHSAWSFVPWHALNGIRNNSLKKVTRYRGEKSRPDLPKREELEATSRRFSVKYLLGVMNSSSARDFLRANRRSNIHLYPDDWKKLPVPDVPAEQQQPVVKVVNLILVLQRHFHANQTDRTARDTVLVEFLENLNDALVREIYDPEPLHARSLYFGRLVTEASLPKTDAIRDSEHLEKIRRAIEGASDINATLRAALFDLGSVTMAEKAASNV
jgi:adenine-specific DNA-methyltransferase